MTTYKSKVMEKHNDIAAIIRGGKRRSKKYLLENDERYTNITNKR